MLDTNVLASAILFPGKNMDRLIAEIDVHHELYLASYVLEELKEVVKRKFPARQVALDRFLLKARYTYVRTPEFPEEGVFEIRDAKDYPVLYTAMIEDVDILITGDKDFAEVDRASRDSYSRCIFRAVCEITKKTGKSFAAGRGLFCSQKTMDS